MPDHSLSFDRAADFYDQTRGIAPDMATIGIQTVIDLAGQNGSILEVGVGTGRIAVPLLKRGANLFGCDLSIEMMGKLREKYPAARLAQADAAQLPYLTNRFDALTTFHVLHLVGAWRSALREFKRVLKPNGLFINSWHWHDPNSIGQKVWDYWRKQVEARGVNWQRPGIQEREELLVELRSMGAHVEEKEISRGVKQTNVAELLDSLANRISSDTWNVPDDVLIETVTEARVWAKREFGDLDRDSAEEYRIIFDITRF